MILDEELEPVRNSFEGNTLIHGIPILPELGAILDHVGINYFEPPIMDIEPFQYKDKAGVGVPFAVSRTTKLSKIKKRQKYRRVGVDRLSICGKAEFSK